MLLLFVLTHGVLIGQVLNAKDLGSIPVPERILAKNWKFVEKSKEKSTTEPTTTWPPDIQAESGKEDPQASQMQQSGSNYTQRIKSWINTGNSKLLSW